MALTWTEAMMTKLELSLNEAKTWVRGARQERIDFLGYSFGPHYHRKDGNLYRTSGPPCCIDVERTALELETQ